MSRLSPSPAPAKWDEEGLETATEMRKKDRKERRRNSTDSNAVLNGTTEKGSWRSAEGRKSLDVVSIFWYQRRILAPQSPSEVGSTPSSSFTELPLHAELTLQAFVRISRSTYPPPAKLKPSRAVP